MTSRGFVPLLTPKNQMEFRIAATHGVTV